MEAHSFLRLAAEAVVGVPLEDAAAATSSSTSRRSHRSPSQPASRASSPSRRAASASGARQSTANSIFTSIAQSLNTAPSSRAQSRASSRRSSIDYTHSHAGSHEDTPHRNAVREAFIKRDIEELRRLSAKGFVNDSMRRLVWPLLLNASTVSLPPIRIEEVLKRRKKLEAHHDHNEEDGVLVEKETNKEDESEQQHRDEYQVELDVARSFVHYPIDETRDKRRIQLSQLIVSTLRQYPALNYFQGYHDVVSILLLVSEDDMDLASRLTVRLSLFHIRDSMMSGLDPAIGYLRLLKRILKQADPILAEAVNMASSLPYFSLSWVLTLLAHDLISVEVTSRIFDFLLAHNPAMVSYLCAAIVMAKKEDLEALDPDVASDPATVHTTLAKLPTLTADPPNLHPASYYHLPSAASSVSMPSSPATTHSSTLATVVDERLIEANGDAKEDQSNGLHLSSHPLTPSKRPYQYRRHHHHPLPLETLFNSAQFLYEQFPLSHPDIQANTIFGPRSAIFTWEQHDLSSEEAETIVREGTDVIIPEPVEEEKEDLDKLDKISEGKGINRRKLAKRYRELQARRFMRGVLGLINSNTRVFALVGVVGVLIALNIGEDTAIALGIARGSLVARPWWWMRDNWLVRWGLGKTL